MLGTLAWLRPGRDIEVRDDPDHLKRVIVRGVAEEKEKGQGVTECMKTLEPLHGSDLISEEE